MAYMQSRTGGIGKHVQYIEFGLAGIVANPVDTLFGPKSLPFPFYSLDFFLGVIRHVHLLRLQK
jgi:hypothetical protein